MNTEQTPVENYAASVVDLIKRLAMKEIGEHQFINLVLDLRANCLDQEKREHQRWFNKGFEFYHEQLMAKKLTEK